MSEILESVLQTVQKNNNNNLHIDSTYTYRLYRRQCAKKHIHILSTHSVLKDIVTNTHYTLYTVCTHSTLCTHLFIVICEGATDYTLYSIFVQQCRLFVQQIVVQRCNRLFICNVVDVRCMVSSDSRCVSAVCACCPVELC